MQNSRGWNFLMRIPPKFWALSLGLWALSFCSTIDAKMRLPQGKAQGTVVNDLPVPYNLQAVLLNKAVTLRWKWQPPDLIPDFDNFGYEVKRKDGKTAMVSDTVYSDVGLAFGTYSYVVRVRGDTKENGRHITHVSDWSEPAEATIKVACSRAPSITLAVESTRKSYSAIPSLRLHLTGGTHVPEGCTLTGVTYLLDTGMGITHSGTLKTDAQGRFDDVVEAIGPDDEVPAGSATFTVSATAEDEAGPTTSDGYSITVDLQNKFAPHDPN
jgi:hypothetical protein